LVEEIVYTGNPSLEESENDPTHPSPIIPLFAKQVFNLSNPIDKDWTHYFMANEHIPQ